MLWVKFVCVCVFGGGKEIEATLVKVISLADDHYKCYAKIALGHKFILPALLLVRGHMANLR